MRKRLLVPGVMAAVMVFSTGCGVQLTKLSDEDENKMIVYCTQVVSKHNMNNDSGLVSIAQPEPEEKEEQTDDTKSSSEEPKDSSSTSSSSTSDDAEETESTTFTDAIGIDGMQFLYRDAQTANGYQQGDVYDLTPDEGNELLVVRLKAKNTTSKSIDVDMPSEKITFTAAYGDDSVDSDMTLLMNDLTTYQGTFKAKKGRNMILLFQFPKGTVKDANKVQLTVTKGDSTVSIDKNQSKKS